MDYANFARGTKAAKSKTGWKNNDAIILLFKGNGDEYFNILSYVIMVYNETTKNGV